MSPLCLFRFPLGGVTRRLTWNVSLGPRVSRRRAWVGVRSGTVMGDVREVMTRHPSRGALPWFSRRSGLALRSFSTPSPCRGFSPPVRTASLSRPCPGRSSSPNLSGVTTANSELEGLRRGDHSRSAGFGRLGEGRGE